MLPAQAPVLEVHVRFCEVLNVFVVKVVLASVGEENKPRPLECDQEPEPSTASV